MSESATTTTNSSPEELDELAGKQAAESAEALQLCPELVQAGYVVTTPEGDRVLTLAEAEERQVRFAIDFYGWNMTRCARALGCDRRTLYRLVERYKIARGPAYTFREAPLPELISEHPGGLIRGALMPNDDHPGFDGGNSNE